MRRNSLNREHKQSFGGYMLLDAIIIIIIKNSNNNSNINNNNNNNNHKIIHPLNTPHFLLASN